MTISIECWLGASVEDSMRRLVGCHYVKFEKELGQVFILQRSKNSLKELAMGHRIQSHSAD